MIQVILVENVILLNVGLLIYWICISLLINSDIFIILFPELLTFVEDRKGTRRVIIRNHIYYKHYLNTTTKIVYWKCHLYDKNICKARCKTDDNCVTFSGLHSHGPDLGKVTKLFSDKIVKQVLVENMTHQHQSK